ncbi:hypothetical protein DCS_00608 [Drechmeria coniospora]|uniref:DASH complex subunit DAD4 n=1 Tax=Drechmeria coniospora TaxID=98403 RepID=A0A151GQY9_DRECN|nr:hypothetical protein DCS_00608 [Drechmeria coniospora]KYK59478.1 hypothetical protein DCS_00608 [Drechmeria coniospora]
MQWWGRSESPHEHQQNLLLSRIVTNVVRIIRWAKGSTANAEPQEKLNEAVVVMNKTLQDINIQNMNVELVAQMFKNYQSNVLFHLEGSSTTRPALSPFALTKMLVHSNGQPQTAVMTLTILQLSLVRDAASLATNGRGRQSRRRS